ncbi:MAG: hypothetical protein AAGB04_00235 [Pseudomonadota bacterium]
MRTLNGALAELDSVAVGKVVKAALVELSRQVSHDQVARIASSFVEAAIDNWDPPGPKITDQAVRRVARRNASQAVHDLVKELLAEIGRE